MNFADHGYPSMPITYSINRTRQAQIIARTLGVDVSQIVMNDEDELDNRGHVPQCRVRSGMRQA
jgi:hypothetical protein